MTFETWWDWLLLEAMNDGHLDLIATKHPEQYRDYYDAGDSPKDVILDEYRWFND